jgi:hypothetical protein
LRVALAVGLLILGYGILYDGLQQISNCPETLWGVMNPLSIYQPCTGSGTAGSASNTSSTTPVSPLSIVGQIPLLPGGPSLSNLGL